MMRFRQRGSDRDDVRGPVGALVALGVWLLVVAAGSGLVWTVISAAGASFDDRSGALPAAPTSAAGVVGGSTADPTAPTSAAPAARSTRSPSAPAPSRSSAPAPAEPAAPSSPSSPRGTDDRPRAGSDDRATSPARPAPSPRPVARSRTWSGAAGVVTSRCAGTAISLAGASASPGYAVEVKERGPGRVEVEFEGRDDGSVAETKVRASCVGGVPTYRVETDG